jgi:REP element-mobilizing transposase RayT
MARGIERRKIFRDDKDRKSFLDRLAIILQETQTQCYAWSLIPNHFHLLLRTGPLPLSKVMRRLMTGYAVTFNKRHKRSGHLFQNRYKSVICEEDPYLLELIRYIHLNPLRAKLVQDLKELDKYPWTGHSTILGRRQNPLIPNGTGKSSSSAEGGLSFSLSSGKGKKRQNNPDDPVNPVKNKPLAEKTTEDVLLYFGVKLFDARMRYRHFVKKGIAQGTRPEFQGGGLVRSAGGDKRGLLGRKKEEREKGDERILGSGDFVNEALMKAGKDWEKGKEKKIPLAQLIRKVASHLDLKEKSIFSASRRREISEARSIISYLAINDMGYSASDVGRALSINRVNAGRRAARGQKVLDKYQGLKDIGN